MRKLWCRTDICSRKFSAKVSLTLDNPFPVTSLCKLNHISVCFIQISTKITCKLLIPFRESHVFFEVIPGVLGRSVDFNINIEISIETARVSKLSVSCDYDVFMPYHIENTLEIYRITYITSPSKTSIVPRDLQSVVDIISTKPFVEVSPSISRPGMLWLLHSCHFNISIVP